MATRASGTAASVEHEVEASRGCAGVEASAQARRGVSAVVLGTKGRSRCGLDATRGDVGQSNEGGGKVELGGEVSTARDTGLPKIELRWAAMACVGEEVEQ